MLSVVLSLHFLLLLVLSNDTIFLHASIKTFLQATSLTKLSRDNVNPALVFKCTSEALQNEMKLVSGVLKKTLKKFKIKVKSLECFFWDTLYNLAVNTTKIHIEGTSTVLNKKIILINLTLKASL